MEAGLATTQGGTNQQEQIPGANGKKLSISRRLGEKDLAFSTWKLYYISVCLLQKEGI
jgi:hypothetical protein